MNLTPQQLEQIHTYRGSFPYRIIYIAIKADEWFVSAVTTKRIPNKLAREGYQVAIIANDSQL